MLNKWGWVWQSTPLTEALESHSLSSFSKCGGAIGINNYDQCISFQIIRYVSVSPQNATKYEKKIFLIKLQILPTCMKSIKIYTVIFLTCLLLPVDNYLWASFFSAVSAYTRTGAIFLWSLSGIEFFPGPYTFFCKLAFLTIFEIYTWPQL